MLSWLYLNEFKDYEIALEYAARMENRKNDRQANYFGVHGSVRALARLGRFEEAEAKVPKLRGIAEKIIAEHGPAGSATDEGFFHRTYGPEAVRKQEIELLKYAMLRRAEARVHDTSRAPVDAAHQ